MKTYISILRVINLSGKNRIKMDELKQVYLDLKFKNCETYIQSGNVVFQYKDADVVVLGKLISKKIASHFGFDVPVLVMRVDDFKTISLQNPFVNLRSEDPSKLHVTFLADQPETSNLEKLSEVNSGKDEFEIQGKAIYLFCPEGYGNTKLSNNFFESKLKQVSTTRNWKTVNELLRIAENL